MLGIEFLVLIPFTLRFKSLARNEKWIYYYLLVSFIFAGGSLIWSKVWGNNMIFVNTMTLLQFYILSMFYATVIKGLNIRKVVRMLTLIISIVFVADIMFVEGHKAFNSIFTSIRTLVLLVYGVIFFLQLQKDEELIENAVFINTVPNFWFNAGLFVYLCCSFILTLSYNLLQRTDDPAVRTMAKTLTMSLNYAGGVIEIIFFYIGFLKIKRPNK
ncbi:hypothetical protein MKQ70_09175 [Chitinophaga sedimenti]|uniref:hypothetical protein n=1 Tax=Chitinophaga sedimenti TaxID=2033606 RepID=UPI0020059287|nr:hypothetical protein [Chitinophaga sedimenti]MCK7555168.1 hypothetical protein [Chitinophaga sedimenti]